LFRISWKNFLSENGNPNSHTTPFFSQNI
jgi:hypothetical protein